MLQAFADGLEQCAAALFSLVVALLLFHTLAALLHVELFVSRLQRLAEFQLLLFQLVQGPLSSGTFFRETTAIPGGMFTNQGPDCGDISEGIGPGGGSI